MTTALPAPARPGLPSTELAPLTARQRHGRDDPELVVLAQQGDEGAWELLYAKYRPILATYLLRRLGHGDSDDADDLAQDVLLKAWCRIGQTGPGLKFGAWIFQVATNHLLDVLRHRGLVKFQVFEQFAASHADCVLLMSANRADYPEGAAEYAELQAEVRAVLDRLDDHAECFGAANHKGRFRLAMVLREYCGLSYDEIAARLQTTRAAVKSQLHRSRNRFRELAAQRPYFAEYAGAS